MNDAGQGMKIQDETMAQFVLTSYDTEAEEMIYVAGIGLQIDPAWLFPIILQEFCKCSCTKKLSFPIWELV